MFLSIIVPVYNVELYLKQCLTSLKEQELGFDNVNYEVIVVNDGSTDNSESIAQSFCSYHSNFHFYSQHNQGQAAARNLAIEHARGEYITFVDSDDYVSKDLVTKVFESCENSTPDVLYFDRTLFSEENSCVVKYPYFFGTVEKNPDIINRVNLSACNKVFSKELLLSSNIRFPEGVIYEDFPFVLYSMLNAKNITKCDHVLYNVRTRRPGSTTTSLNPKETDLVINLNVVKKYLKPYSKSINKEYSIFYNRTLVGWAFKLTRLGGYDLLDEVDWKNIRLDGHSSTAEKVGLLLLKFKLYKLLSFLLHARKKLIKR